MKAVLITSSPWTGRSAPFCAFVFPQHNTNHSICNYLISILHCLLDFKFLNQEDCVEYTFVVLLCIHSLDQYLFRAYYVPGMILVVGHTAGKRHRRSVLPRSCPSNGETDSKHINK